MPKRKKDKLNKDNTKVRAGICIAITAIIFLAFVARLFSWQIVNGDNYKQVALSSTTYSEETDATRGEILDVNGVGLTVNKTCYKIIINRLYVEKNELNSLIESLLMYMDARGEKWQDVLPIVVNSKGEYSFKANSEDEVKTLKSSDYLGVADTLTATDCMSELTNRYKLESYTNHKKRRDIASVRYNMELCGFSSNTTYDFALDISPQMMAIISENFQNVSGVDIATYFERHNPDPQIAPHLLGALGLINEEEYTEKTALGKNYNFNDKIGKFGIESSFEDVLKGQAGEKIVKKNSNGKVLEEIQKTDANPGKTIYLTIDSKIQTAANKALAENVKKAKEDGEALKAENGKSGYGEDCKAGAAVMLSVKDFSVLAAASYPTYDLEKYSLYDDYYVDLVKDEKNAPLYDRVFNGSFAPGSIFKPCVAVASLEEKVVTDETIINCTKVYDYYKKDTVSCMGTHGYIDLNSALTQSCNYFFAESGRRLGINTMYLYAEKFGLGEKTGVEISESTGILAGRDSTTWTDGNTVQAAIGQSDNAFTPIQLATYVATIANDGKRYKTHLVSKITDYKRQNIITQNDPNNPTLVDTVSVSQENLQYVQNAMRNVVESTDGTAHSVFGNYKVKVAAKTGTAENSGSDHTTFICYAPFDKPEVAVAVVIENGARGKYSMNVAKAMLDAYFAKK